MSENQHETWVPVLGFEGRYEVSDQGRVRSITNELKGRGRPLSGKILKPKLDKEGYEHLGLRKNGTRKWMRVHRIVLEAFAGKTASKEFQVDHIDGNLRNNVRSNLQWITAKAHVRLSDLRSGGRSWLRGEKNPMAKLTSAQVEEIRRLKKEGITQIRIAEMFGVGPMQISRIVRFKRRIFS